MEVLLGEGDVADHQVVGIEGDRDAAAAQLGDREIAVAGDDGGLRVAGGTEVERNVAGSELGTERWVIDGDTTMSDARGLHLKGAAHLRGTAPLPRMEGDREPTATCDVE